jgi:hypothetical protein
MSLSPPGEDCCDKNGEEDGTAAILVLLLGGLPGAGKSTLARGLQETCGSTSSLSLNGSATIPIVQVVEYDGIEEALLSTTTTTMDPASRDDDDNCRLSEDELRLQAWRTSRTMALHALRETLLQQEPNTKQIPTMVDNDDPSARQGDSTIAEFGKAGAIQRIILMDDNYYLRSMRKQVFLTCQEVVGERTTSTTLGNLPILLVHLWLETPLEVCLARNARRKRSVPESVIERMATQMEAPVVSEDAEQATSGQTNKSFHWERVVWHLDGLQPVDSQVTALLQRVGTRTSNNDWWKRARVSPPVDPQIEVTRLAVERQRTAASVRHQIDQALRQAVKLVAQRHKILGRAANAARKATLVKGYTSSDAALEFFCQELMATDTIGLTPDERESLCQALLSGTD